MKKEQLYKQLSSLKKQHRELIKTELYNIEELKADIHADSSSFSASNPLSNVENFDLEQVFFN